MGKWIGRGVQLLALVVTPVALTVSAAGAAWADQPRARQEAPAAADERTEDRFISGTRQLTLAGRRAGEGYFSSDGQRLVFQSERQPDNPFFQIYAWDLGTTGEIQRISPGHGKTTCAWIHPVTGDVLFASTHDDPQAQEKQRAELQRRQEELQSGTRRRYEWDYDEHYELYRWDHATGQYTNLTNAIGYDAEGSYSPDGQWIAFTSNRAAYTQPMDDAVREQFAVDPAVMADIYIMRSDGSAVRQLTTELGYDGGPFFSPDGQRICWRHFEANSAVAEVWTVNVDGTDRRQLTRLGAMSWAPFYHPSGRYLIFTTSVHGMDNFELYLVDVEGLAPPVRVTYTAGFDGLPVFSPCGTKLCWTSRRDGLTEGQLFIADWDHAAALAALGETAPAATADDANAATDDLPPADYRAGDILRHAAALCDEKMQGRMTGSPGEQLATNYVAASLETIGIEPAGDIDPTTGKPTWFQTFEFPAGASLGDHNALAALDRSLVVDKDWRPLSFSGTGSFDSAPVVFAGYGIVAPAADGQAEYDSYVHLDVKDKWVMVFRFMPEDIAAERRQQLQFYASLRYKAMVARDRGARGLLIASGPSSQVVEQLVPLERDASLAATSIPVISISDEIASQWLAASGRDLAELQKQLDAGEPQMGWELGGGLEVSASIDVRQQRGTGRNVVGRLAAGDHPTDEVIVVGAHVDHLGLGSSNSLARPEEAGTIHYGADDNASGVAALLEIAQNLAALKREAPGSLRRDIIFAAWSGEELGLFGSKHFVNERLAQSNPHASASGDPHHSTNPHASGAQPTTKDGAGHAAASDPHGSLASADPHAALSRPSLYPQISAYLNMDMVGRFDKRLILQGLGSSSDWVSIIEQRNALVGLPLALSTETNLPTDATSFYQAGVPILSAFTGSHSDYHTPRDTIDKLNLDEAAQIARLMGDVARRLATQEQRLTFSEQSATSEQPVRVNLRASLGTIPDYSGGVSGVLLSGVSKNSPAETAGVRGGDIVVELAGRKIENVYDYTYAIDALKVGQPVTIVLMRDGQRVELTITPASRQ